MTENNLKNNTSRQDRSVALRGLQRKIIVRAVLIIVTVLLTAVLLFALTAAWYTNVVSTGGLTFSAKQWDFNGRIIVDNDAIQMEPGDSGIVAMHITNEGETTAVASVTVSKARLDPEMQKRLYFYVETPFYRNTERMERVYVTSNSAYAYTVFSGSEILITKDSQNAPALKWRWVYDVLGYYVLGTVNDDSTDIVEYVRPIEYDYDPISTTFDSTSGALKTVDGIKTVNSLLKEISATDGYSGVIDPSAVKNGYYPVYVNEDGYGIWAYLCTCDEIRDNMAYDTSIGTAETSEAYSVDINVTGSNSSNTSALEISNKETLISMINSSSYASLKLTENITLDAEETLVVKSGYRADIDLNGHTLTSSADNGIISAEPDSKITIINGMLKGDGSNYAVVSNGAEVIISEVIVNDVSEGVRIVDYSNDINADSRVHIVDSQLNAGVHAIRLNGNDGDTDTNTTLIIERCTLHGSGYAGITCSGNYKDSDIQITNSTVKGYYTSIYHPQRESSMTIKNSTLEGITGLVVKGGIVNVIDSTVRGIATADQMYEPTYNVSGFTDTGDGIYLEANYEWQAEVNIYGDQTLVTSENALAVRMYKQDEPTAKITISEGRFSSDVSEYINQDATMTLTNEGYYTVTSTLETP